MARRMDPQDNLYRQKLGEHNKNETRRKIAAGKLEEKKKTEKNAQNSQRF